jgi:hypothetical protein
MRQMTNGAIYIITGDPRYKGLLINSAESLKRVMPNLGITVFSQFPIVSPAFERVVQVESSGEGFYDKTRLMQQTPYEKTLFVDADTHVVESLSDIFALLDNFDCAATHEEYLNTDWWNYYPRPDIPESFPEFNTGILAFKRSPAMDRVLKDWSEFYQLFRQENPGFKINDQPFFRAAVYRNDVRIATLTREYNCKFRGQGYLNGRVKILHGHVDLELKKEFVDKAASVLNASSKPRVYIAGTVYEQKLVGRIVDRRKPGLVGRFPLLAEPILFANAKRLLKIIKERGAMQVISRVLRRAKE